MIFYSLKIGGEVKSASHFRCVCESFHQVQECKTKKAKDDWLVSFYHGISRVEAKIKLDKSKLRKTSFRNPTVAELLLCSISDIKSH